MGRPRRPMEPLLERLADGKPPKQVAAELGVSHQDVLELLRRYVKESGCKTLIQAVAMWHRKPPEGVD